MTKNSSAIATGIDELKKSRSSFKGRLTFLTNQWNDYRTQSKPNYPALHVYVYVCAGLLRQISNDTAWNGIISHGEYVSCDSGKV